jgi:hypothetical protein
MATYTEETGLNSNGDAAITITMFDDDKNPIDYTEISASNSDNAYAKQVLVGTEGKSGSLTVYRSGRTCVLKGINYDLKINGPASFYKNTAFQLEEKFRPELDWYSYNCCIAYTSWNDTSIANGTGQALNSPLSSQEAYAISILVDANGYLNGKLHRYGFTTEGSSVLVNFEITWLKD